MQQNLKKGLSHDKLWYFIQHIPKDSPALNI